MTVPQLVAHRGYATRFPENTLLSLEQALRSGACFVEFDVQFCADGTAVVFHDPSLERITGIKKNLLDLSYEEIQTIQVCDSDRFGKQFINQGIGIPKLADVVNLLKKWPHVTVWIDVKKESLKKYSIEQPIKTVMQVIQPILRQCCIISSIAPAVYYAGVIGAESTGWILDEWTETCRREASELGPDYLICNYKKMPSAATPFWPGPWQWCIYEVVDPQFALQLYTRGAALIETMDIGKMLAHPLLRQGGCFDNTLL